MSTGKRGSCPWGGGRRFLPNSTVSGELGGLRASAWPHTSVSNPSRCQNPRLLLWMENWKGSTLSPQALQALFSLGPGLRVHLLILQVWRWDLPKHCQRGHCLGYKLGSISLLFLFAMTSKSVHSIVFHPVIISDLSRTKTTATTYPNIPPSLILTYCSGDKNERSTIGDHHLLMTSNRFQTHNCQSTEQPSSTIHRPDLFCRIKFYFILGFSEIRASSKLL